ncbi:unnamed protein product [Symbiodinium sp. CCMP2592]|nr:unnamed protein product [Symbiodinium sp. CCMP2592]
MDELLKEFGASFSTPATRLFDDAEGGSNAAVPDVGFKLFGESVAGASTLAGGADTAFDTWRDDPTVKTRDQAMTPLQIELRQFGAEINIRASAGVDAGGNQVMGCAGDLPAGMLGPGAAGIAGNVTPYATTAGWKPVPLLPEFQIHDSMTGREVRGLAVASARYYGGITADNCQSQITVPWNRTKHRTTNLTSIFHSLHRFMIARLQAETLGWTANWISPANVSMGIPTNLVNIRAGAVGAGVLAQLGNGADIQFNTVELTNRERVLLVCTIVGFAGVYHDNVAGPNGAICTEIVPACTQLTPGVNSITLFTDGLAGAVGNLQAAPPTYEELAAFVRKLALLRPGKLAYATGKAMAAASGMAVNMTHTPGVDQGMVNQAAGNVAAVHIPNFGAAHHDVIGSTAGGARMQLFIPRLYTPAEYFNEMQTPAPAGDYSIGAADLVQFEGSGNDGGHAQQQPEGGDPKGIVEDDKGDTTKLSYQAALASQYGFVDEVNSSFYFITQLVIAEIVAYTVTTANADQGLSARFWNNNLVPGAAQPSLDRAMMLRVDTDTVAPLDGFAQSVRRIAPAILRVKLPKFVVAMTRCSTELAGDRGFFAYLRYSGRIYGTEQLAEAGDIVLTPVVKGLEKGGPKALVGMLPNFSKEGARFGYRTALLLAQGQPNNWTLSIPGSGHATIQLQNALAIPNAMFAVRAAGNALADSTDPFSVLPVQRWASRSYVAFGKGPANLTPALRRQFTMAVDGKNIFGYAGYHFEGHDE